MKALVPAALMLLAACTAMPPESIIGDAPPATCVPDQNLVGQSANILAAMTFPQGTRIYNSGDPLTMDVVEGRLNIEIGPDGRIVRVSCG